MAAIARGPYSILPPKRWPEAARLPLLEWTLGLDKRVTITIGVGEVARNSESRRQFHSGWLWWAQQHSVLNYVHNHLGISARGAARRCAGSFSWAGVSKSGFPRGARFAFWEKAG